MHQQIVIVGNLGRDPEMRYTPDGRPVTNFSVATNRKWNDANGELQKETVWFRVADFRTAEPSSEYLSKGRQVMVTGRLRPDPATGGPRVFTRQDGTVGAAYEVIADRVVFLGSRAEDGADGEDGADLPPDADPEAEDIPF
jgi:single-strand DNA-binding protein